jgi:hypothetical protein
MKGTETLYVLARVPTIVTEYSPTFEKALVEMVTLLKSVSRVTSEDPTPKPTVVVKASV